MDLKAKYRGLPNSSFDDLIILVIFQTRYFQGQHKGSTWLSLQRNSVRKFALLQKDYFCWTIIHFEVFTKRIPTQGFVGRKIFLAVLLILKFCLLAGSMEGAPAATTRSQFQNMFHLHAISNKCRAHDDIMLAQMSFPRYIWVILRCWGNSSILCQQNSDAL